MFFYFVKKGDNLSKIASDYHTSIAQIVEDNDLDNKNNLSVGQCLLIRSRPTVYEVKSGDTLNKIASNYHVSVEQLKKWNPSLSNDLTIGEKINITYKVDDKDKIKINGYCYEGINLDILKRTLPYLTYLSVFGYKADENGEINKINDSRIVDLALDYNVAPLMVITNLKKEGGFSSDIAHSIINDNAKIDTLLNNILSIVKSKGYYGVNIDFEYVYQKDKTAYENFLKTAYNFFSSRNIFVSTALAPKTSSSQSGLLYEAHNYQTAGKYNDMIILMTYEWGYTYGESMPVSPLNKMESVVKYAISEIDSQKLLLGIPNYAYDFNVPKIKGKGAKSMSLKAANNMAFTKNAEIKYYQDYQTPYYTYYEGDNKHEVQFDNVYSFYKKLELVDNYNLGGISIWTITTYNTPYYLLLKHLFIIEKVF